jgi:hypothetical protein
MDFESESRKERKLSLVIESVIESVADSLDCEAIILVHEPGFLRFQPYLIPDPGSSQRIGPTPDFIDMFVSSLIEGLEEINNTIQWQKAVVVTTTPEGIVTIQIEFDKLY